MYIPIIYVATNRHFLNFQSCFKNHVLCSYLDQRLQGLACRNSGPCSYLGHEQQKSGLGKHWLAEHTCCAAEAFVESGG